MVRVGALLYAAGAGLTLLIDTPLGSNVERLGMIFGSVVFLAALCARGDLPWLRLRLPGLRSTALIIAFLVAGYWTVTSDIVGIPMPSSRAQGAGLVAELQSLHVDTTGVRVEAVPMLNHWESWGLVGVAELARGWNRQADVQRNPLFYGGALTAPATTTGCRNGPSDTSPSPRSPPRNWTTRRAPKQRSLRRTPPGCTRSGRTRRGAC